MSYFLRHNLAVNDIDIIEISINVLILSLSILLFFSIQKRKIDLLNGTPLDCAHKALSSYGLKIEYSILVPGSSSLFVEARKR